MRSYIRSGAYARDKAAVEARYRGTGKREEWMSGIQSGDYVAASNLRLLAEFGHVSREAEERLQVRRKELTKQLVDEIRAEMGG
jgi:hypothetical protein